MIDPERIQRLSAKMGDRRNALELVRQMRCGGKKYPDGGRFFRTNLQQESPMMYQPMMPSVPDVSIPLRYEPQPHYGLYEYPSTTGLAESYPITVPREMSVSTAPLAQPVVDNVAEDLFSEEAMARRALKQRYAESAFNDKAKSKAGAQGAWQIMPITLKDYLGRGRGKAGDLNDPEYNRKVRDWVMGIIPRDLQDLYSESDAPRVKLAKIYGAYNWGVGNMRKYLRKQREAGVDISNDTAWIEGLNPETKRYIKYLALDEDIPDSTYTNKAFEEAAAKRGYMKNGGRIHIKPSHRGRLTELKERTGKTEAELYNDGNPAHKRMVVFARNSRKWKHADGGLINKYDGETEETGWLRRFLSTPTMVPNMTGTATGAATGLRDIPLTPSTVGQELTVAGTALASPFVLSSPQFAGSAVNWLSNPANQILAGKLTVPLLGAGLLDQSFKRYTPWESWGDAMVNGTGIGEVMDYALLPQEQRDLVRAGAEFTNPAFFAPYEGLARGINGAYDRVAGRMARRAPARRATTSVQFQNEPAEAFAVDLSASPKNESYIDAIDETEAPELVAAINDLPEFVPASRFVEPAAARATEANVGSADRFLNERSRTMLRNIHEGDVVDLSAPATAGSPALTRRTRRPITELSDSELSLVRRNEALFGEEDYTGGEIAAELERRAAAAATPGHDYSAMSTDELRNMVRNMSWNDDNWDIARRELRKRVRSEYGITDNFSASDIPSLSNQQLLALAESPNFSDINAGLFASDAGYIPTSDWYTPVRNEIRTRAQNLQIPSTYSSIEDALADYRLLRAGSVYGAPRDRFNSAVADIVNPMVYRGEIVPEEFEDIAARLAEKQYNRGMIDVNNPYIKDFVDKTRRRLAARDTQQLVDDYYDKLLSGARDLSSDALWDLKRSFQGKSGKELLEMVQNMDSLTGHEGDIVRNIVKKAYHGPEAGFSSPTRMDVLDGSLIRDELVSRFPEWFDNSTLDILSDPFHPNYVKTAELARANGISELPGDIAHLAWFQTKNALQGTSGMSAEAIARAKAEAEMDTAIQTAMLERAMPRQTGILEQNTSPQSYKVKIKGALRAPGGYGVGPGQTSLMEIPARGGTYTRGNNLQTTRVLFNGEGKMYFQNPSVTGEALADLEKDFFTRDELNDILSKVDFESYDYSIIRDQLKTLLEGSPEARKTVDKLIRLSRKLNAIDVNGTTAALKVANRIHEKLGLPYIAPPTQDLYAVPTTSREFYDTDNLERVAHLIRDAKNSLIDTDKGLAMYMNRTPLLTLRHKYGGLINRIGSVYGKDSKAMMQAISNARARQKK